MSEPAFTGERLHEGNPLFRIDMARHRAAYRFAIDCAGDEARQRRIIDFGCGSGHGTVALAEAAGFVVGIDRVPPDRESRRAATQYVRADLERVPLASDSFDLMVSFQVIEHLNDPTAYLESITRLLRPAGTALITTPNILTSDGVNPFHVHEYEADELGACLRAHFEHVEMRGVGTTPPVAAYLEARLRSIRRIMRLDPLRLRERLPRGLIEWLFGRLAIVVRRGIARSEGLPDVTWRDFPIGAADPACLDLLAICRGPRPR